MHLNTKSNYLVIINVFLVTLLLQACSVSNKKTVFSPAIAPADKAIVYIYRPTTMSNAIYSPDLYINDEFKLSLKNGKNTRLSFEHGEYKFEIEPEAKYEGETGLSLTMTNGHTYYIQVTTSLKLRDTANYQPYQRSFNLTKVEESFALEQIADCCLKTSNKKKKKTKNAPPNRSAEEGFSVDKTQNPFSH